jgi:hypothetical protein
MANDYDTTAKNVMLDQLATVMTRVALHSGDPGAANAADNELAGGGYARQAITWNAASGGAIDSSNAPAFSVEGGDTVSWISFWNTGGTVRYAKKNVTDEAFGSGGTYTLTDADFDLNDA